jgi:acetolactate synthase regulatory subunit
MFTAYIRSKSGNITLSDMVCKQREVEDTASKMSKMPDVARVSVAAHGRIILSFKDGVRIDSDAP